VEAGEEPSGTESDAEHEDEDEDLAALDPGPARHRPLYTDGSTTPADVVSSSANDDSDYEATQRAWAARQPHKRPVSVSSDSE
jgi:hypothetical protein